MPGGAGTSISLREFLGYGLAKTPPEHSTLSKTRKRLSLEAHGAVFGWVLERCLRARFHDLDPISRTPYGPAASKRRI